MAYLSLFAAVADGGMSTVTTREIAQDYTRSEEFFVHVFLLRMLLAGISYGMLIILGGLGETEDYSLLFIMSCGIFLFPETIRKLGISMLSAYERMDIVASLDVMAVVFRYVPFVAAILLGKTLQVAFVLFVFSWICVAGIWLGVTKHYCLTRWQVPLNYVPGRPKSTHFHFQHCK